MPAFAVVNSAQNRNIATAIPTNKAKKAVKQLPKVRGIPLEIDQIHIAGMITFVVRNNYSSVPEVRAALFRPFVLPARLIDDTVLPDQVDVIVKYPRVRRVQLVGEGERLGVVLSGQGNDFAVDVSLI